MIKFERNIDGKLPNVWVTSDTHYNHTNICRGVTSWRMPDGSIPVDNTRDFPSLDKMNAAIVNNINAVVGQDDILLHVGDWSFGGFDSIEEFWNRLVCKNIYLILGNHDHHIERNKNEIRRLFTLVSKHESIKIDGHVFQLMHYPISSWDGLNRGHMHLHGHCHLPTHKRFGVGRRMDVGIDGHPEFRPYHLINECAKLLIERPISSEISDHHSVEFNT